jgi:hypothetical protein
MYKPLLHELAAMRKNLDNESNQSYQTSGDPIFIHMKNITALFIDNPWLASLISKYVMSETGLFKKFFKENVITPFKENINLFILHNQARGRYKKNIDTELLIISIISLTAMPHICKDLIQGLARDTIDSHFYVKLLNHNFKLLEQGITIPETACKSPEPK